MHSKPMTDAQRSVLRQIAGHRLFPGYCEIMLHTGLKSYRSVDWVLDALERRGLVERDRCGEYLVTAAGRSSLEGRA